MQSCLLANFSRFQGSGEVVRDGKEGTPINTDRHYSVPSSPKGAFSRCSVSVYVKAKVNVKKILLRNKCYE